MTQCSARIIEDSVSNGVRLTTMQLRYPRFIHSEFMTHRVFSRNASSSRAIPVHKTLAQVRTEPAMPCHWGENQPGMQADKEVDEAKKQQGIDLWMKAANNAADIAEQMEKLGLHKQVVNRIMEPFAFIQVVVTSTYWDNFWGLRCHPDADPMMQQLAAEMKKAFDGSQPTEMVPNYWHLPYVTVKDWNDLWNGKLEGNVADLVKFSVARCARVSYMLHDGTEPNREKDLDLYNRLAGGIPPHMSPFEHQARPKRKFGDAGLNGNLDPEWVQFRKCVENDAEYQTIERFCKGIIV